MKFMMITANPDIAQFAVKAGVDRIFVDLENHGKQDRQKNRNTWISSHRFEDVAAIRASIGKTALLVRLNPWHPESAQEIQTAIQLGADLLMLPMFKTTAELSEFCRAVDDRIPVIPLVETVEALGLLPEVARTPGVGEVFIGLNDLHIAMGMTFMFEPLADGHLDKAAITLKEAKMPFGFGGIARIGKGLLRAETIIGEHVRLGSSSVILSRTFHRESPSPTVLQSNMDFTSEICRLRQAFTDFSALDHDALEENRHALKRAVSKIVEQIQGRSSP